MMGHAADHATPHRWVAALYVDRKGPYFDHPAVDPWDEARDARLYDGPWPVIAHPPCARWSSLAYLNRALHGYQIGDDGGCFAAALSAVRRFGGVLEHPAQSIAWATFDLPRPAFGTWKRTLLDDGWVTAVDQAAYGHRARKRTWLYACGCDLVELDWRVVQASGFVSSFAHGKSRPEAERVRPREASRTPEPFAEVLVSMASSAVRRTA